MKKIVLLGDSIRLAGYGTKVPELLSNICEVWQPTDNCRFSFYTLRNIRTWEEGIDGADIIHWNNGLWDVSDRYGDGNLVSADIYVETMLRIARILKKKAKTVIFATTTPVRPCPEATEDNADIVKYNALVMPELEKLGVVINDLHSVVEPHIDTYICEDNVHLSPAGIDACAEVVASFIKQYL
ncbi:MAG: SGNH/GDSL hydrolase family protein [Clostridia bacterium]|nr:SGNH/GDSL hydrolase family protein [Clostridia bacterium]